LDKLSINDERAGISAAFTDGEFDGFTAAGAAAVVGGAVGTSIDALVDAAAGKLNAEKRTTFPVGIIGFLR
jgi:hypothetical protein